MNLITIINKFCLVNSFLPWQLYGSSSEVVVRYKANEKKEFTNFANLVSNLKLVSLNTTVFVEENKLVITKGIK